MSFAGDEQNAPPPEHPREMQGNRPEISTHRAKSMAINSAPVQALPKPAAVQVMQKMHNLPEFLILRYCVFSTTSETSCFEMATAQLRNNPPSGKRLYMTASSEAPAGQGSFVAMDQFLGDLDREGISLRSLQLLIHLKHVADDCKRLNMLASAIGVTGAGITGVADSLEDKGLVVRMVSRQDRRSIYLSLTPNGIKFANWVADTLGKAFRNRAA